MSEGFPVIAPQVRVMHQVSHKFVHEQTFFYKGPALLKWSQSSQLLAVIKQIQAEFNEQPPIPIKKKLQGPPATTSGAAQSLPEQPQYTPEKEVIERPLLNDLKKRVDT